MMASKKKVNPWYKAKRMLHDDYLNDFVTEEMGIDDVYHLRPEYEACEFQKFKKSSIV